MAEQKSGPENRGVAKIERPIAGAIELSTTSGMLVKDVGQAMEVAKLMSISGSAVPAHIRNSAGTCLAVAIQAWEWSMNPFAVANKSYVVNDRLAYESALYNAVVTRRAPIVGRLKIAYVGEGAGRRCTVSATLRPEAGGGVVDYQSPKFGDINPKNSPLWKNDPDQQLFYFSVRAFVRRHFPDVMMGVYTVDELEDSTIMPLRPVREVGTVDIEAALGKGVEQAVQPGGSAETAPQPKAAEAEDEPPAPEPAAEPETPPSAAPVERSMADKVREAWGLKLKELKGIDFDADLVEEQLDAYYLDSPAKLTFSEVVSRHPKWLPKLLEYIPAGQVRKERFDFNVNPAPEA
jgi:hypothetical protein